MLSWPPDRPDLPLRRPDRHAQRLRLARPPGTGTGSGTAPQTDMRKGFDSLAHLVESALELDPLSGHFLMLPSLPPSLGTRFFALLRAFIDLDM